MLCPNCNTLNDPSSQFCIKCGQALAVAAPLSNKEVLERPPSEVIGIFTIRLVVVLFVLWVFKVILTELPFVKELVIPEIHIATAELIAGLVYLIIALLLLNYVRTFNALWPQAYPSYREAAYFWSALIYLGVLAATYILLRSILLAFALAGQSLVILQIAFLVLALFIVFRAGVIFYQVLPVWIARCYWEFRRDVSAHLRHKERETSDRD